MTSTLTQEKTLIEPEITTVAKLKKATAVESITENMSKTFNLTRPSSDFHRDNNPALKRMRIVDLSLSLILLWLGRHIVRDHYIGSKWFGGEKIGSDFVFWFKEELDRDKAEMFLNEIVENGTPRPRLF